VAVKVSIPSSKVYGGTVTGQRHISLVLADRILLLFEESGASEAERLSALDVVRALVPVLPNASCSGEATDLLSSSGSGGQSI
jgi:hypothetical protein